MSAPRSLVNGAFTTTLSVGDRGLAYGDGLFETLAVQGGRPCLWRAHLERLQAGADRLAIPCPPERQWRREAEILIGSRTSAVLKLILTRGTGGRGYGPPERPEPTRILSLYPRPPHPPDWEARGIALFLCRTRLADQPILAGIKHLNRLEQVLARAEWRDPEYAEGLLRDSQDRIIGGTASNLFLFRENRLITPRLDRCGIRGTVRQLVMQHARRFGLSVEEGVLFPSDLLAAEGLFLTNALIGAWPVARFENRRYDPRHLPQALLDWLRVRAFASD